MKYSFYLLTFQIGNYFFTICVIIIIFRNCLFRALGDQLDGNNRRHHYHRSETVKYMIENRNDFEPFVEDDCSFHDHGMCLFPFITL